MVDLLADPSAEYEGQAFTGLALSGAHLTAREFERCVFSRCSFHEAVLERCRFVECRFKGCDLSLCRLEGCSFVTTRFEDCQIVGVNWTEAAWPKRGLLSAIGFQQCALSHSTFFGLSLKGLRLSGCLAHDVDFAEADLSQADCTHTDFQGSRFLHTNLAEADFTGAVNYQIAAHLNVLKRTRFSLPEAMSLLYSLDIVLSGEDMFLPPTQT